MKGIDNIINTTKFVVINFLSQRVCVLVALTFVSLFLRANTCDSTSLTIMEQSWREFRAIHPFGFQTVGLKHYGDTCVFVMSEPNNWVKDNDLRQLFNKHNGQLIIRTQLYGIDGQLTDAIGCAKLDSIHFLQLEKELFTLLYRTAYKPFYTDLDHPSEHVFFSEVPLNYSYTWERLKSTRFLTQFPNDSIGEMSIPRLCNFGMTKTNEIFYSKHRGFVVWVIAENIDYQNDSTFLVNARKFVLDSDLICGTFRSINRIAIIGREREVPVNILPPLRSETILSLASNIENLSLVFNKDSIKIINDTLNATPIKMSSLLIDIELGNLLVMTDIFLKSWSENGKVKEYIINYPQPNSYPFPYGVSHALGDSTRLIWNFENVEAGYSGFYPVIQTGSLPPTYWSANDSLMMMQNAMNNIAYNYFAKLNCPDLVRVTMYMALHRIFQGFGVKCDSNREFSRVQTPSFTISNKPWAYGGYQGWLKGARGLKSTAELSRLTASQLQKVIVTQTRLLNAFSSQYSLYPIISERNIIQILKNSEQFLKIASVKNITKLSESLEVGKTLNKSIDALTILSSNSTDTIIKARINTCLSKAYELSKKYGLDNPLEPASIIIHSVVPKETPRGLNFDEHVKPTSSRHILTEDELKQKLQDNEQHQIQIQHLQNTIREYKLKIRPTEINTGFVYIRLLKYDKDFQLSA